MPPQVIQRFWKCIRRIRKPFRWLRKCIRWPRKLADDSENLSNGFEDASEYLSDGDNCSFYDLKGASIVCLWAGFPIDVGAMMLTQDFCNYLEHQVSAALSSSTDPGKKNCWCDGILLPASTEDYALHRINDTKEVLTRAWMGKSGQDPYALTIRFGKKAVRYYMRGNDLEECVPSTDNADWIVFDKGAKTALIELL